jgi:hypothetical protein
MLKCGEIEENLAYREKLLNEVKRQSARYFILLVCMSTICLFLIAYIFYDRQKDSEASITATETKTVIQDSNGHNSYVDGEGDIINGSNSEKTDCKKTERK